MASKRVITMDQIDPVIAKLKHLLDPQIPSTPQDFKIDLKSLHFRPHHLFFSTFQHVPYYAVNVLEAILLHNTCPGDYMLVLLQLCRQFIESLPIEPSQFNKSAFNIRSMIKEYAPLFFMKYNTNFNLLSYYVSLYIYIENKCNYQTNPIYPSIPDEKHPQIPTFKAYLLSPTQIIIKSSQLAHFTHAHAYYQRLLPRQYSFSEQGNELPHSSYSPYPNPLCNFNPNLLYHIPSLQQYDEAKTSIDAQFARAIAFNDIRTANEIIFEQATAIPKTPLEVKEIQKLAIKRLNHNYNNQTITHGKHIEPFRSSLQNEIKSTTQIEFFSFNFNFQTPMSFRSYQDYALRSQSSHLILWLIHNGLFDFSDSKISSSQQNKRFLYHHCPSVRYLGICVPDDYISNEDTTPEVVRLLQPIDENNFTKSSTTTSIEQSTTTTSKSGYVLGSTTTFNCLITPKGLITHKSGSLNAPDMKLDHNNDSQLTTIIPTQDESTSKLTPPSTQPLNPIQYQSASNASATNSYISENARKILVNKEQYSPLLSIVTILVDFIAAHYSTSPFSYALMTGFRPTSWCLSTTMRTAMEKFIIHCGEIYVENGELMTLLQFFDLVYIDLAQYQSSQHIDSMYILLHIYFILQQVPHNDKYIYPYIESFYPPINYRSLTQFEIKDAQSKLANKKSYICLTAQFIDEIDPDVKFSSSSVDYDDFFNRVIKLLSDLVSFPQYFTTNYRQFAMEYNDIIQHEFHSVDDCMAYYKHYIGLTDENGVIIPTLPLSLVQDYQAKVKKFRPLYIHYCIRHNSFSIVQYLVSLQDIYDVDIMMRLIQNTHPFELIEPNDPIEESQLRQHCHQLGILKSIRFYSCDIGGGLLLGYFIQRRYPESILNLFLNLGIQYDQEDESGYTILDYCLIHQTYLYAFDFVLEIIKHTNCSYKRFEQQHHMLYLPRLKHSYATYDVPIDELQYNDVAQNNNNMMINPANTYLHRFLSTIASDTEIPYKLYLALTQKICYDIKMISNPIIDEFIYNPSITVDITTLIHYNIISWPYLINNLLQSTALFTLYHNQQILLQLIYQFLDLFLLPEDTISTNHNIKIQNQHLSHQFIHNVITNQYLVLTQLDVIYLIYLLIDLNYAPTILATIITKYLLPQYHYQLYYFYDLPPTLLSTLSSPSQSINIDTNSTINQFNDEYHSFATFIVKNSKSNGIWYRTSYYPFSYTNRPLHHDDHYSQRQHRSWYTLSQRDEFLQPKSPHIMSTTYSYYKTTDIMNLNQLISNPPILHRSTPFIIDSMTPFQILLPQFQDELKLLHNSGLHPIIHNVSPTLIDLVLLKPNYISYMSILFQHASLSKYIYLNTPSPSLYHIGSTYLITFIAQFMNEVQFHDDVFNTVAASPYTPSILKLNSTNPLYNINHESTITTFLNIMQSFISVIGYQSINNTTTSNSNTITNRFLNNNDNKDESKIKYITQDEITANMKAKSTPKSELDQLALLSKSKRQQESIQQSSINTNSTPTPTTKSITLFPIKQYGTINSVSMYYWSIPAITLYLHYKFPKTIPIMLFQQCYLLGCDPYLMMPFPQTDAARWFWYQSQMKHNDIDYAVEKNISDPKNTYIVDCRLSHTSSIIDVPYDETFYIPFHRDTPRDNYPSSGTINPKFNYNKINNDNNNINDNNGSINNKKNNSNNNNDNTIESNYINPPQPFQLSKHPTSCPFWPLLHYMCFEAIWQDSTALSTPKIMDIITTTYKPYHLHIHSLKQQFTIKYHLETIIKPFIQSTKLNLNQLSNHSLYTFYNLQRNTFFRGPSTVQDRPMHLQQSFEAGIHIMHVYLSGHQSPSIELLEFLMSYGMSLVYQYKYIRPQVIHKIFSHEADVSEIVRHAITAPIGQIQRYEDLKIVPCYYNFITLALFRFVSINVISKLYELGELYPIAQPQYEQILDTNMIHESLYPLSDHIKESTDDNNNNNKTHRKTTDTSKNTINNKILKFTEHQNYQIELKSPFHLRGHDAIYHKLVPCSSNYLTISPFEQFSSPYDIVMFSHRQHDETNQLESVYDILKPLHSLYFQFLHPRIARSVIQSITNVKKLTKKQRVLITKGEATDTITNNSKLLLVDDIMRNVTQHRTFNRAVKDLKKQQKLNHHKGTSKGNGGIKTMLSSKDINVAQSLSLHDDYSDDDDDDDDDEYYYDEDDYDDEDYDEDQEIQAELLVPEESTQ